MYNRLVTELMICQGPLVGDQDKTQHVLSLLFILRLKFIGLKINKKEKHMD